MSRRHVTIDNATAARLVPGEVFRGRVVESISVLDDERSRVTLVGKDRSIPLNADHWPDAVWPAGVVPLD